MIPFETPWPHLVWRPVTGRSRPGRPELCVLHPERLMNPLDWPKPALVLLGWDGADPFADPVPERFLFDLLDRILVSGGHLFVVLTASAARAFAVTRRHLFTRGRIFLNLWLGVPAATQEDAQKRAALLAQTPVAGRFVWCLPPGPQDLSPWLDACQWVAAAPGLPGEVLARLAARCAAAGVPFFDAARPDPAALPPRWRKFFEERGKTACSSSSKR